MTSYAGEDAGKGDALASAATTKAGAAELRETASKAMAPMQKASPNKRKLFTFGAFDKQASPPRPEFRPLGALDLNVGEFVLQLRARGVRV